MTMKQTMKFIALCAAVLAVGASVASCQKEKFISNGLIDDISAYAVANNNPLPGEFTVSVTEGVAKKVKFAKGNLTYNSGTWSFLANSWTYNSNPSAKGVTDGSQHFNWGEVFNASSGTVKNEITTALGSTGWNALSRWEWVYLLGYDYYGTETGRSTTYGNNRRFSLVQDTNDKTYMLIYPDDFTASKWTTAMGTAPDKFNTRALSTTKYTVEENFPAMQNAGIVILPAAGWGGANGMWTHVGDHGSYWSSLPGYSGRVLVSLRESTKSYFDFSVRLVQNVE